MGASEGSDWVFLPYTRAEIAVRRPRAAFGAALREGSARRRVPSLLQRGNFAARERSNN